MLDELIVKLNDYVEDLDIKTVIAKPGFQM